MRVVEEGEIEGGRSGFCIYASGINLSAPCEIGSLAGAKLGRGGSLLQGSGS